MSERIYGAEAGGHGDHDLPPGMSFCLIILFIPGFVQIGTVIDNGIGIERWRENEIENETRIKVGSETGTKLENETKIRIENGDRDQN
ncbi:hypothetical protein EVAR_43507_1 [Eumeta japonica]|uniref:Uncharacterized protein n=1 Tax=Eumeta variegata TaxID=151549 RepID=A0A4C1YGV2_EUMVA|nr:hypothetical protein EVAR_43507_1 [Eumeta japonica]